MSKRVFLHIGGEKTGTTTLQRFLTRNAFRLKRAGFHYPCHPNDVCFFGAGHFPIAACLIDEKVEFIDEKKQLTLSLVLGELAQRISAAKHNTILSCEHFSSRLSQKRQLATLRDALSTDDIKIVFYIREPSDLALAAWSTAVRYGARHAFSQDLVTPENRYYNHLKTLTLWSSVFGESNLIVREYNRSRLVGGDIRNDFCSLLGLEPADFRFEQDENRSFDLQRLEVLRHINCALPDFRRSDGEWRRAQAVRDLVSAYIPSGAPLQALISSQEKNLIKSRFREISKEINERYFGGLLSADWFPDATRPEAAVHHCSNGELGSVLRETIIRIAEANVDARAKGTSTKRILARVRQRLLRFFSKLQSFPAI
jgi:hypothetical protein